MFRARLIEHNAALGAASRWIDIPALGSRRNQQITAYRPCLTQRRPEGAHRGGTTRILNAYDRVDVKRMIWGRMLNLNLIKPDFQFFGEKHRQRRIDPLSHLDHRYDQVHGAGWIDPYKSVR